MVAIGVAKGLPKHFFENIILPLRFRECVCG